MLQAMLRNKFAPSPEADAADADVSAPAYDSNSAKREDTLTSTVLGLLLQLPDKLLWQVIRHATARDLLPEDGGELLSYEFWPHWSAEGIHNADGSERRLVEPDFFLQFAHCNLIGEAKYGLQQDATQWENEIRACNNEQLLDKPCFLIAIGGNDGAKERVVESACGVKVIRLEWVDLLLALQHTAREESTAAGQDSSGVQRTLQFLQQALAYFNLAYFSFLGELQRWNNVNIAATANIYAQSHSTQRTFLETLTPYNQLELTALSQGTVFTSPPYQPFLGELQRWNDGNIAATATAGLLTGDFT